MMKMTSTARPKVEQKNVSTTVHSHDGDVPGYIDLMLEHAIRKHNVPEGVAYTYEFDVGQELHTYRWVWYEMTFEV